jgi:two-component system, cell cycle response regulator CpdR
VGRGGTGGHGFPLGTVNPETLDWPISFATILPALMARILVVDDDEDVRELLELALHGDGHDVDSVDSGRAALQHLAQHAYDLIVCDLHMPDRDGPALHRALARQPPPRPAILFVTGYAHAGPYDEFLNTTQAPVVSKPFTLTTLRETVRRVLSQS